MQFNIGAVSVLVLIHTGCTEPDLRDCAPGETTCAEECPDGLCPMSNMDGGPLDGAFDPTGDGSKDPPVDANVQEQPDDGGATLPCPLTLHVNGSAARNGDGKSWQTALRTLGDAIERAGIAIERCGTATIWIAHGRYTRKLESGEDGRFSLPPGLDLYGGFAGTELALDERKLGPSTTILDGEGRGTVLRVIGGAGDMPHTVLDGITITGGSGYWYWPSLNIDSGDGGGGLHVKDAHVTMRNLMFVRNVSHEMGAAVSCEGASTLEITGSNFTDNYADRGGAITSGGCTVRIERTKIVDNGSGPEISQHGGALTVDVRFDIVAFPRSDIVRFPASGRAAVAKVAPVGRTHTTHEAARMAI